MSMALHIGRTASAQRAFHQEDFDRFAALSGDDNPIHVDPDFSARTKFGRTVAHGMFLYGVVSGVLGTQLPGPGTVQIEQELMFPSPTYTGDKVTVHVEVTKTYPEEGLAELTTVLAHPGGNVGLQGRTLVHLPGAAPFQRTPVVPDAPSSEPSSTDLFKGLQVGQRAETHRVFTGADLAEYVDLTGDSNPVFADAGYARKLGLEGPIVPGALLGGLFSYLLGTRLPGQGTNYLKQRLIFPRPAYPGRELLASVEIVRIRPDKQLANLRTRCRDAAGEIVCYGEALVLVSDVGREA